MRLNCILASDINGHNLNAPWSVCKLTPFLNARCATNPPQQSFRYLNSQWISTTESGSYIPMTGQLSNTEAWSLLACSVASLGVLKNTWSSDGAPVFASLALSGLAFSSSYAIIRWTGDAFIRVGRKGKDMSKKQPIELLVITSPKHKTYADWRSTGQK
jgi:hypothetical protein